MDEPSSIPASRPGVPGLDIFKIAGQSISGFLPSWKTGDRSLTRQPYISLLEARLAMHLEYHPHVRFYQRGDVSEPFARARHLITPLGAPYRIGYVYDGKPHDYLPALSAPRDREEVLRLRADVRALLGASQSSLVMTLNPWLDRYPIVTVLEQGQEPMNEGLPLVRYRPLAGTTEPQALCAELLSIVVEALAHHTWTRLKACLDCQWVFYDRSKNTSKVWCGMLAEGPLGRSCGSIAKVRRWRERQKALKQHEG